MAEFAITLPILLLLVFGVIEFGRAFQAWVSIQNAARTAARYASTRQFDTDLYPITRQDANPLGDIVGCVSLDDQRGSLGSVLLADGTDVDVYTGGQESLFATWYDGLDCEPGDSAHQFMREDIARIPSIWNEARRGAAGLALPPDPLASVTDQASLSDWLENNVWNYPLPDGVYTGHAGSDQPSYFDVMICSSREPIAGTVADSSFPTRYITNLNGDLGALTNHTVNNDLRAPVCILNETPPAGGLNNVGVPWADAGTGGNTVTIVISFNHPLVTPLGLAPYLPLQARRSAIVESFQQANSLNTLLGGPALTADINIPPVAVISIQNPGCFPDQVTCSEIRITEAQAADGLHEIFFDGSASNDPDPDGYIVSWEWTLDLPGGAVLVLASGGDGSDGNPNAATPNDFTAFPNLNMAIDVPHRVTLRVVDNEGAEGETTVEFTIVSPDPPDTSTPTFTAEPPSDTPAPFACDRITVSEVAFFGSRVYFNITNANNQASELLRVTFQWPTLSAYPNMAVTGMALDGIGHWQGWDTAPTTDTAVETSSLFDAADRTIPANNTVAWEAIFSNGPSVLNDPFNGIYEMTQNDFTGTDFVFYDPEAGASCVVPLDLPTATPAPTLDPNVTLTPSWTPDCAGTEVRIRFEDFQIPGLVRISVTNLRTIPAQLTDFRIVWVDRGQVLEWVGAGGNNGSNISQVTRIWTHASGGDGDPPTTAGTTAATANEVNNFVSGATGPEANWEVNYSFPPNSTTNLWIKFGVTATSPDIQWGMAAHEMNGTWFQLDCPNPGAPGGPGGPSGGQIPIFNEPSPEPTNTPGPTNTDLPTLTPSNTYTPRPTNTPGLPPTTTNTPPPSNTPVPTATQEDEPPDDGGSVCTEGCG